MAVSPMARYLVSFPAAAMVVTGDELEAASRDSHAVIEQAKSAGVYVFGGGMDASVPPLLVSADGTVTEGGYPWAPSLDGGFAVLELPSREEAIAWAARLAKACRCHLRSSSAGSTRSSLLPCGSMRFTCISTCSTPLPRGV